MLHLKTAWSNIRRSPFQALAAVFVLAVTFFVTSILSILVYSSGQVLNYFETRPQVIAFLKEDTSSEVTATLQEKLKKDPRLKAVTYVSKEKALEIYKKATSDNPLLSELVSPSIFPASLEFSLVELGFADEVINELEKEEIVDQVGFTGVVGFGKESIQSIVDRLRNIIFYIKAGGTIFVATLLGTSFLVLLVIIGMRMTTRRTEVEILDLIGATPGFIRSPIVIEAILYSVFGVFLGWAACLILVLYSTPSIFSYFGEIPVLPRDTLSLLRLFGLVLVGEILVSLSLSLVGSVVAVSRARRRK